MADERGGEYFAFLGDEDTVEEFEEPGYSLSGVFQLMPVRKSDDESSLPVGRTLVEE
jgi:hypothetical protein